MSSKKKLSVFFAIFFLASPAFFAYAESAKTLNYTVIRTLPHDAAHFTQGLIFHDGKIFESTGLYGESALYAIRPPDGKILRSRAFPRKNFAEGLALLNNRLYQISWLDHLGIVYDLGLKPLARFTYEGEGWGLTGDGRQLIMSNGSSTLQWFDPANFKLTRSIEVTDDGAPVQRLNELEYAKNLIYANVWLSDRIAAISPDSGQVLGWLDLSELKKGFAKPADWAADNVLNGIAYDRKSGHFFVTGKRWPVLYELEITDK